MDKFKILQKKDIEKLPESAGVYAFKSKEGLLYIGKAINIKKRVKNHFNPARNASRFQRDAGGAAFKDNILSEKTTHIGYLETNSQI